PTFVPDPVLEIRLWRQATTVFMMSGPGGCEPFGLAVTAHESGLSAEIYVSFYGALFLQSVRSAEKRRVMELAQVDFRRRAEHYGIPVKYRAFGLDDIREALAGGRLVLVLVSGFLMFGKKVPHWVLAISDDGDHILLHDPWVDKDRGETTLDAANIPVPYGIFMDMAQLAGTDCVPRSSSESAKDNDLGHTNRPPAQSRPGIHPAQDHHQSRLPFPSRPVSRPETQGHQPVEPLQLPESGLLCLAARVLARTSRHPDRGDADRPVRAQAL